MNVLIWHIRQESVSKHKKEKEKEKRDGVKKVEEPVLWMSYV